MTVHIKPELEAIIAEDLKSSGDVTLQSGPIGLEFNSQWDDTMVNVMREVVSKVNERLPLGQRQ